MPSPQTALAAVFESPGQAPELRSILLPELLPGETLVRINCCTICGSDVHSWTGKRHTPLPSILGHEIVGTIESFGPGVPAVDVAGVSLAIGDRVVWAVVASCGRCERCRGGMPQKCLHAWKYGHQALHDAVPLEARASPPAVANGDRMTAGDTLAPRLAPLSGGLATHCHLVAGTAIVRVPPTVPDELASTATCAGATICAALAAAGPLGGGRVLVTGAGMLGLLACAMAVRQGATSVTVVDLNADRLRHAERLGASQTASATPDGPFDVLIECTGKSAVTLSAIARLDVGGRAALVGAVYPDQPLSLDAQSIVRRLLTIRGVHNYTPTDLAAAVTFLAGDSIVADLAGLTSNHIDLKDTAAWVRLAESGATARTVVRTNSRTA